MTYQAEITLVQALADAAYRAKLLADHVGKPNPTRYAYNKYAADYLEWLVKHHMPNGSGFDNGCKLVSVTCSKVVITAEFHHMNEAGFGTGTGWSDYRVTAIAEWGGRMTVTCRGLDRNGTCDYVGDTISDALDTKVPSYAEWLKLTDNTGEDE